ncbi:hypothetical protein ATO6_12485 [Oceanicola sp. 22II-s10i]|uniref:nuclear transport factor 2 family protein n=1 Tax=Oceanicola sp. 22II-s10i TaxID=1317116 RepID=UPI000B5219C2|nr:nuclear transport factor 2 family protein [Oceanicola sp. 22II-s10i]OWU84497.1 hypothetical protein ATO6_12485 [Oceanicola sp. 22II-s10i]
MTDRKSIVARFFAAITSGDRAMVEAMVAEDFTFTSPRDNALDRAAWFRDCYAHTGAIEQVDLLLLAEDADRVFVTYEAVANGARFRNTEVFTVAGEMIHAVEVYFGWTLPHPAPSGGSVPPA